MFWVGLFVFCVDYFVCDFVVDVWVVVEFVVFVWFVCVLGCGCWFDDFVVVSVFVVELFVCEGVDGVCVMGDDDVDCVCCGFDFWWLDF